MFRLPALNRPPRGGQKSQLHLPPEQIAYCGPDLRPELNSLRQNGHRNTNPNRILAIYDGAGSPDFLQIAPLFFTPRHQSHQLRTQIVRRVRRGLHDRYLKRPSHPA